MIKNMRGEKVTANQLAKEIIKDTLESAFYWDEKMLWEVNDMTEREQNQVNEYVEKQFYRVRKLLK